MEALLIILIAGVILLGIYTSRKKLPRTSRDSRIDDSGAFYPIDSGSSFIHSHPDASGSHHHNHHYDHSHGTHVSDWSSSDSGSSSFSDGGGSSSDGGGGGDSGGGSSD
ncbi:hypothetical protein BH11VER1_BH11VER1_29750 [soil metagenome]